jgi:hypothetical protein
VVSTIKELVLFTNLVKPSNKNLFMHVHLIFDLLVNFLDPINFVFIMDFSPNYEVDYHCMSLVIFKKILVPHPSTFFLEGPPLVL